MKKLVLVLVMTFSSIAATNANNYTIQEGVHECLNAAFHYCWDAGYQVGTSEWRAAYRGYFNGCMAQEQ